MGELSPAFYPCDPRHPRFKSGRGAMGGKSLSMRSASQIEIGWFHVKGKSMNLIASFMLATSIQPDAVAGESAAAARSSGDYVVLLHGLGRTPLSMKRLEWALERENFRVINLGYPSTRISIEESAARLEATMAP